MAPGGPADNVDTTYVCSYSQYKMLHKTAPYCSNNKEVKKWKKSKRDREMIFKFCLFLVKDPRQYRDSEYCFTSQSDPDLLDLNATL